MLGKSKKQYSVVLSYDVQKTFIVEAIDEDEAYDIAYNGEGEVDNEDWEYREHIETEEV
jgi:hypothetical protein